MNGIIIIDKPLGRTSHDMVYVMRKMTGIKKVCLLYTSPSPRDRG